jgi:hypothetical protein
LLNGGCQNRGSRSRSFHAKMAVPSIMLDWCQFPLKRICLKLGATPMQ